MRSSVSHFLAGKSARSAVLAEVPEIAHHPDGSRAPRAPLVSRKTQGTLSPLSFDGKIETRAPPGTLPFACWAQTCPEAGAPLCVFDPARDSLTKFTGGWRARDKILLCQHYYVTHHSAREKFGQAASGEKQCRCPGACLLAREGVGHPASDKLLSDAFQPGKNSGALFETGPI